MLFSLCYEFFLHSNGLHGVYLRLVQPMCLCSPKCEPMTVSMVTEASDSGCSDTISLQIGNSTLNLEGGTYSDIFHLAVSSMHK